jgi:hypothetical protein
MIRISIFKLGKWIAILSFVIGSAFFWTYFISDNSEIIFTAYYFVIFAVIVNSIVLIILFLKPTLKTENRNKKLVTSGFILVNIPIALIYFYFVLILVNTMRITLKNETGKPITNLEITGCETVIIDRLEIDESKTCWIGIDRDCSIDLQYNLNGELITDEVFSYVTTSMGLKAEFRIGTQKEAIDETF